MWEVSSNQWSLKCEPRNPRNVLPLGDVCPSTKGTGLGHPVYHEIGDQVGIGVI